MKALASARTSLAALLQNDTKHFAAHREARHFHHVKKLHQAEPETPAIEYRISRADLKVVTAPLVAIARQGLKALSPVAWVHLLQWPGGVYAAATIVKLNNKMKVVKMESGEFPRMLQLAVQKLRATNVSHSKDNLRLIEIPRLHTHVVWLHRKQISGKDAFIPLVPDSVRLKAGRRCGENVFEPRLKIAAKGALRIRTQDEKG